VLLAVFAVFFGTAGLIGGWLGTILALIVDDAPSVATPLVALLQVVVALPQCSWTG
jgi:hypothetical protein